MRNVDELDALLDGGGTAGGQRERGDVDELNLAARSDATPLQTAPNTAPYASAEMSRVCDHLNTMNRRSVSQSVSHNMPHLVYSIY